MHGTDERARLLELDPDLGMELDEDATAEATARLGVRVHRLEPGPWDPVSTLPPMSGALGLLLVDGLLVRDVQVAKTSCSELLGGGDLLRPWDDVGAAAPIPARAAWQALETVTSP